ncbi:hypothetical protein ACOME3_001194 [Neoechinorhynchus agilis]
MVIITTLITLIAFAHSLSTTFNSETPIVINGIDRHDWINLNLSLEFHSAEIFDTKTNAKTYDFQLRSTDNGLEIRSLRNQTQDRFLSIVFRNRKNDTIQDIRVKFLCLVPTMVTFEKPIYNFAYVTNRDRQSIIGKIMANLSDGSSPIYHILPSKYSTMYIIDSSGYVTLSESEIDFDSVDSNHEIVVEGNCKTAQNCTRGYTKLVFRTNTYNEYNPEILINFSEDYHQVGKVLFIPEELKPGSFIAFINLFDEDGTSKIHLSLRQPRNYLKLKSVHESAYTLIINRKMDREQLSEYNFSIVAEDNGYPARITVENLTIALLDINDNPPKLNVSGVQIFRIDENSNDSFIGTLNAYDEDSTNGGGVRFYMIRAEDDCCEIDEKSGNIRSRVKLDFERKNAYDLLVRINDLGEPMRSITTKVRVMPESSKLRSKIGFDGRRLEINDLNDNSPLVLHNNTYTIVSDNLATGSIVYRINANDADSGENGHIEYQLLIEDTLHPFGVDKNGHIFVAYQLPIRNDDRDACRDYLIRVNISDNGIDKKFSTIFVHTVTHCPPKSQGVLIRRPSWNTFFITVYRNQTSTEFVKISGLPYPTLKQCLNRQIHINSSDVKLVHRDLYVPPDSKSFMFSVEIEPECLVFPNEDPNVARFYVDIVDKAVEPDQLFPAICRILFYTFLFVVLLVLIFYFAIKVFYKWEKSNKIKESTKSDC